MKKILILNVLALLFSTMAFGQKLLPNTTLKADSIQYLVKALELPDTKAVRITNVNNRLNIEDMKLAQQPYGVGPFFEDIHLNYKILYKICTDAFQKEKLSQLSNRRIGIIIFYTDDGKPLEVQFIFDNDLPISPSELEYIEKRAKKEMYITFENDSFKGSNFIPLRYNIGFSELLSSKNDPNYIFRFNDR